MPLELASCWWAYVLLGLCAGVVSGTLGLGSGTVFIPALVILFAFPQKSAQGTALAVMVPMALVGAFRYWLNPEIEVDLTVVGWIIVGALGGALVGTELASRLPALALRQIFAMFLLVVAFRMLITPGRSKQPVSQGSVVAQSRAPLAFVEKGSVQDDTAE